MSTCEAIANIVMAGLDPAIHRARVYGREQLMAVPVRGGWVAGQDKDERALASC